MREQTRNRELTRILKRLSLFLGLGVMIISIQFSYDGFDQSVSGINAGYTSLAVAIGYTLAILFTVIEFIFGTSYKDLNTTLRVIGVFAYVYSIYTNFLGVRHLLGTSGFIAWSLAFIIDVFPEPAIAWALGESMVGDLFGNLGKIVFGAPDTKEPDPRNNNQHPFNLGDRGNQNHPQGQSQQPKHIHNQKGRIR